MDLNQLHSFKKNNMNSTYGWSPKVGIKVNDYKFKSVDSVYRDFYKDLIGDYSLDGVKPLTKQQIFDLTFKWNELTNYFIQTKGEKWYDTEVCWCLLSFMENLPIEFLREYQDRINWKLACESQFLTEDTIWEFKDKVIWNILKKRCIMSDELLKKAKEGGYIK